jgi:hypothetical protein
MNTLADTLQTTPIYTYTDYTVESLVSTSEKSAIRNYLQVGFAVARKSGFAWDIMTVNGHEYTIEVFADGYFMIDGSPLMDFTMTEQTIYSLIVTGMVQ